MPVPASLSLYHLFIFLTIINHYFSYVTAFINIYIYDIIDFFLTRMRQKKKNDFFLSAHEDKRKSQSGNIFLKIFLRLVWVEVLPTCLLEVLAAFFGQPAAVLMQQYSKMLAIPWNKLKIQMKNPSKQKK